MQYSIKIALVQSVVLAECFAKAGMLSQSKKRNKNFHGFHWQFEKKLNLCDAEATFSPFLGFSLSLLFPSFLDAEKLLSPLEKNEKKFLELTNVSGPGFAEERNIYHSRVEQDTDFSPLFHLLYTF